MGKFLKPSCCGIAIKREWPLPHPKNNVQGRYTKINLQSLLKLQPKLEGLDEWMAVWCPAHCNQ